MGISIHWRPADDDGKTFKSGLSSEYLTLVEQFGQTIQEIDVPMLRAMARVASSATGSKFYDEVADTVERVGAIRVWDSY